MTREEAKKILEAYIACERKKAHFECDDFNCDDNCPLLYDMGTVGEYNEAINMAIQALSFDDVKYHEEHGEVIVEKEVWEDLKTLQEPTGDLISRQAVLSYINRIQNQGTGKKKSFEFIQKYVEKLSSVNPQELTGHWYIDERPESNRETICSNCEQPILKYHKLDFDYRPKFCPNCGANMSEIPTGSKDVIWHDKRNYSEIVVESQESEEV